MGDRRGLIVAVVAVTLAVLMGGALAFGVIGTALLGGALIGGGCDGDGGPGGGSQQIGPRSWSAEQTANAQTITSVALGRALPRRAAVIAVSTAIVESGLRNLGYGDRDSLGLFQQRPSQGWGTPQQIMTPTSSAGKFYDHLMALPGWATMPAGQAAQAVQRSAVPTAYAPQESAAEALVAQFWTGPDNPIPTTPAAGSDVAVGLLVFGRLGCPDQGSSDIPLPAGDRAKTMPPGFQLPTDARARAMVAFAAAQLGKPYVWGATGPAAFDCSGLTQAAAAAGGAPISRTTTTQIHDGGPVTGLDQAQPGDLMFIAGSLGSAANPRHVGIYVGHGLVINAYDTKHGVIVEQLARWAPEVVAIRRVLTPGAAPAGRPPALAQGASS
jgi:cell wall-associated NlpC family hydrolase